MDSRKIQVYAESYQHSLRFSKSGLTLVDPKTGQYTKSKVQELPDLGDEAKGFEAAIKSDPLNPTHHFAYSDFLRDNGREREADFRRDLADWLVNDYDQAKSDDPKRPWSVKYNPSAEFLGRAEPAKLPGDLTAANLPGNANDFKRTMSSSPHVPQHDRSSNTLYWRTANDMFRSFDIAHLISTGRKKRKAMGLE